MQIILGRRGINKETATMLANPGVISVARFLTAKIGLSHAG